MVEARSRLKYSRPNCAKQRIRLAISDGIVVAYRNLVTLWRVPTVLVFELVQPVMFVLLFRYIYADQFNTQNLGGVDYVLFLMPGIFVQTVTFGAMTTGVGLAQDMATGLIERFRSLPMARSAVLAGRTTADLVRNVFVVLLMLVVGVLVGFRPHATALEFVGGLLIVLLFAFALSWIFALVGMSAPNAEAAQAMSFSHSTAVTADRFGAAIPASSASQTMRAKCSMLGFSPANWGRSFSVRSR